MLYVLCSFFFLSLFLLSFELFLCCFSIISRFGCQPSCLWNPLLFATVTHLSPPSLPPPPPLKSQNHSATANVSTRIWGFYSFVNIQYFTSKTIQRSHTESWHFHENFICSHIRALHTSSCTFISHNNILYVYLSYVQIDFVNKIFAFIVHTLCVCERGVIQRSPSPHLSPLLLATLRECVVQFSLFLLL